MAKMGKKSAGGPKLLAEFWINSWWANRNSFYYFAFKTIPMEKKYKKAKWLSEESFQIAVKRREVKGKGEKETIWMQSSKE